MGGASIWHWLIVGVVVMLLFGRGKISELMGDAAKGIKAFKKGMADDDDAPTVPVATTVAPASTVSPVSRTIEHASPAGAMSGTTPAPAKASPASAAAPGSSAGGVGTLDRQVT